MAISDLKQADQDHPEPLRILKCGPNPNDAGLPLIAAGR